MQLQNKIICPVAAFVDYIAVRPASAAPFFCHFDALPLTRFQFNAVLRKALIFADLGQAHVRAHSFRIGAATAAFNKGVSGDHIKDMGRWRSDAFLSYIRPITSNFLPDI